MAAGDLFQAERRAATVARRDRFADKADIDMTPMIDMTCLLLIFFMLTNSFESQKDLNVPEAEHGVGVESAVATFITLEQPAEPGGPVRVLLGDVGGEPGDLEAVRRWVADGLAQGRRLVVIKAEGRVPHREVRRVAEAAAAVEGVTLHFGVREKQ